jgi:hypothetical protein
VESRHCAAGQGGTRTVTARVRSTVPAGTQIVNQAEYTAILTMAPPAAAVTTVVP